MADFIKVRNCCLNAINEMSRAEKIARDSKDKAEQQKSIAIPNIKEQIELARHEAEKIIAKARGYGNQGDEILKAVALKPSVPTIYSAPQSTNINDLYTLIQQNLVIAQRALSNLNIDVRELIEERKKWWKFW